MKKIATDADNEQDVHDQVKLLLTSQREVLCSLDNGNRAIRSACHGIVAQPPE